MKILNKLAIAIGATLMVGSFTLSPVYAALDTDSANVNLNVGLFASLTGLDDFTLVTSDPDGAAGAIYAGNDTFNLESNGQIRVNLSGADLANGADSVATSYALDDGGITFDTATGVVHNAAHEVSAEAVLGAISAQKAGTYSGVIILTVSAI